MFAGIDVAKTELVVAVHPTRALVQTAPWGSGRRAAAWVHRTGRRPLCGRYLGAREVSLRGLAMARCRWRRCPHLSGSRRFPAPSLTRRSAPILPR